MNNRRIIFVIVSAWSLAACNPAVSLRPLYQNQDINHPTKDPRIVGEWISPAMETGDGAEPVALKWKVSETHSGAYSVEVESNVDQPRAEQHIARYNARLVRIGEKMFFDADFQKAGDRAHALDRDGFSLGIVPVHLIGQVWIQSDFLMLALPSSSWVRDNTPESFREFVDIANNSNAAVITGSNGDLRQFLIEQADNPEAFEYLAFLCRPDTDCLAAGYEYLMKKYPEAELSETLIDHSLEAGNYTRAIELLRKSLRDGQEDLQKRKKLARALLLNREYSQARQEYLHAQEVTPEDDELQQGIGWSYFLEGDFSHASVSFEKSASLPSRKSIDPLLLSYICLKRSGKAADSDALLEKEIAQFKGEPADHLLLLLYGQRFTDYPYEVEGQFKDKGRSAFFAGELQVARGNALQGAGDLWRSIASGEKGTIYGAASKAELERMQVTRSE